MGVEKIVEKNIGKVVVINNNGLKILIPVIRFDKLIGFDSHKAKKYFYSNF